MDGTETRLARLLGRGTAAATAVIAIGAALEWTPWQRAATVVVLAGCGVFAVLPVAALARQAACFRRLPDRRHLVVTAVVLVVVLADALTAGILAR